MAARSTGFLPVIKFTLCIQPAMEEVRYLPQTIKNGKLVDRRLFFDSTIFMDLPGRRSHEYFPQVSSDGKWLVWAATQRGHDHDIADYEIYLWKSVHRRRCCRLTFHSETIDA